MKSDLLIESFLLLIKSQPLAIFLMPFWLLKGKAYLKQQIAQRANIDPVSLPYNQVFLEYLKAEAVQGRRLILATASDVKLANKVAEYLGIFDQVLASNGELNLKSKKKLDAILDQCRNKEFGYAGNAHCDLPILCQAQQAILVNPDPGVEKKLFKQGIRARVFEERATGMMPYLKAFRVHQWLKNVLIFVPLITAHQWANPVAIMNIIFAFFASGAGKT